MSQKKQLYTSDMSDKEWQTIKALLPLEREGPGRPIELDMRVEAAHEAGLEHHPVRVDGGQR